MLYFLCYTVRLKKGVACHAFTNDFQNFWLEANLFFLICHSMLALPYMVVPASCIGRYLLFLLRLHFKRQTFEILVTYLIFAAENDPAFRKCLKLLYFLCYTVRLKKGVACHAFTKDFQNFWPEANLFFRPKNSILGKSSQTFLRGWGL